MLAAACLLAGCVRGDTTDPSGSPRRELAATPESLPPLASPMASSPSASARPTGPGATIRPSGAGATTPPSGATIGPPATSRPPSGATIRPGAPYRSVGSADDRANDAEGDPPPFADLASVTIEDDGSNVRVRVWFHGDVPTRLAAEETMGVGVDFFRGATQIESDYQLFADGQPEGWFAYLQTPKGFVRFPGRFGIGGRRLEFVVPWSAIGSPSSRGYFSAFADWSRDEAPVNRFGEDHVPNLGKASFTR